MEGIEDVGVGNAPGRFAFGAEGDEFGEFGIVDDSGGVGAHVLHDDGFVVGVVVGITRNRRDVDGGRVESWNSEAIDGAFGSDFF